MSPLDANSRRDDLVAAGWLQGAVFTAADCAVRWNDGPTGGEAGIRALKAREKLIVTSQTCDIAAPASAQPHLEALVYRVVDASLARKLNLKSTQWFLIDAGRRDAVFARHKILIAKGALENLTPEPWPGSPELKVLFAQWLARRYARPAYPDQLQEFFVAPTGQALAQLAEDRPGVADAFNSAVREIRINQFPIDARPPYLVRVVFLLGANALTPAEAVAIDDVFALLQSTLDERYVSIVEQRSLSAEAMSVSEYMFATVPLLLDELTYGGEALFGADPLYNEQNPE